MVLMRCQEAISDALSKEKVKYVFGMPGGHNTATLYDSLNDHPEIKPVLVRHEEAASFMACVWHQITGEPGVCSATAGPGVAHLTPGIWEAYQGNFGVVAMMAATAQKGMGMGLLQEVPQFDTFKPVSKWTFKLERPDQAQWMTRRAFGLARSPPSGPIVLHVPLDLGDVKADFPEYTPSVLANSRASNDKTVEAANLILKSERPVLAVGGGALRSRAFEELREFAELLSIPVLRTETGMGAISDKHPLVVGGLGFWRTSMAKKVYKEADLVIGVGWHMEETSTMGWEPLPKNTKLVQIDADPTMIAKNYLPDVGLVGDAKLVLKDLTEYLRKTHVKRREHSARIDAILQAKKEFETQILPELTSNMTPIFPPRLYHDIQKVVPEDATYIFDVGSHIAWDGTYPYFNMNTPFHASPSDQACIGFGVGGALAGKLARPDKPCVCVCGDAGVYMMGQELATQYEQNAPVTTIFLNNFGIKEIKYWQNLSWGRSISCDYTNPYDFVKFAESQKACGYHVTKPEDIVPAIKSALKNNEEGISSLVSVVTYWEILSPGFMEFLGQSYEERLKILTSSGH
jgi:acetolactate synthase-1/2/3 large subunit